MVMSWLFKYSVERCQSGQLIHGGVELEQMCLRTYIFGWVEMLNKTSMTIFIIARLASADLQILTPRKRLLEMHDRQ
jgi:hypothetical protein